MTPTLREAAQRLLDALDVAEIGCTDGGFGPGYENGQGDECGTLLTQARKGLQEALANEPQEEQHVPTTEDIESQDWAGMDGAIAHHLIERHAEDWPHVGRLMHAWRDANPPAVVKESLTTEQPGAVGLSERDEFEAWFGRAYDTRALQNTEDGCYLDRGPGMAWDARNGRAALAAAQPEAPGWLPIETAPKDGTSIMVYPPTWNEKACSVASYNSDKYAKKPRPYWSRDDSMGRVSYSRECPPTHWMPLPPPPTATQDQEKGDAV